MEIQVATKLSEIMELAFNIGKQTNGCSFEECVGMAFWKSFGKYEQSPVMQEIYSILCDMGCTPLESHQNY